VDAGNTGAGKYFRRKSRERIGVLLSAVCLPAARDALWRSEAAAIQRLVDCLKNRWRRGPKCSERRVAMERKPLPGVALTQGAYYLLTGLWPLIDIESFQVVTGPKTDLWLVRTVGVLVSVIGVVLVSAARRRTIGRELMLLGVGSALALAAIDVVYVLSKTIPPVYLADAAIEIGLAAAWALSRSRA
jgi:hypothetical protein